MNRRATRVVNGTADDDPSAHKMISSRKKIPKTILAQITALWKDILEV
jgi:hypothetical protein